MKYFFPLTLLFFVLMLTGCNENTRIANKNSMRLHEYNKVSAEKLLGTEEVRELSDETIVQIERIAKAAHSGMSALEPVAKWLKHDAEIFKFGEVPEVKADVTLEDLENNFDHSIGVVDSRTQQAEKEVEHSFYKKWKASKEAVVPGGIGVGIMSLITAYLGISKFRGLQSLVQLHKKDAEDHRNVAKINAHYAKHMEDLAMDPEIDHKNVQEHIAKHRQASATKQQQYNVADKMGTVLTEVKMERNPN